MENFHDYLKLQSPEFASELDCTFDEEGLKVFNSLAEAWASERYHKKNPQLPNSQAYSNDFPVTPYDGMR